jgi:hypothetical protein
MFITFAAAAAAIGLVRTSPAAEHEHAQIAELAA